MLKYTLAASAAVAAVLALSVPSYADDSATVNITGAVGAACSLSNTSPTIALGTLTPGTDGTIAQVTKQETVAGTAWCNGGHNSVQVEAWPLTTSATAASGFTNRIDYSLSATGYPGLGSLDTVGSDASTGVTVNGSNIPAFYVSGSATNAGTLTTDTSTNRVLAGAYTGKVTVTLTPGL